MEKILGQINGGFHDGIAIRPGKPQSTWESAEGEPFFHPKEAMTEVAACLEFAW